MCADELGRLPVRVPRSLPHEALVASRCSRTPWPRAGKAVALFQVGCSWKACPSLGVPCLLWPCPSPPTEHLWDLKMLLPGCFPLARSQPSRGPRSREGCERAVEPAAGWASGPLAGGPALESRSQTNRRGPWARPVLSSSAPASTLAPRAAPGTGSVRAQPREPEPEKGQPPGRPLDLARCPGTTSHPRLPSEPRPEGRCWLVQTGPIQLEVRQHGELGRAT